MAEDKGFAADGELVGGVGLDEEAPEGEDGGELDEKIIALPFGDPTYAEFKSIHELPAHLTNEMMQVFKRGEEPCRRN